MAEAQYNSRPDEAAEFPPQGAVPPADPSPDALPRNGAAVTAFRCWVAAVLVFVVAVVVGVIQVYAAEPTFAVLSYPVYAAVLYTPLLLFGLVSSLIALGRNKRLKLAIVSLILNLGTLSFPGLLLFLIISTRSGG